MTTTQPPTSSLTDDTANMDEYPPIPSRRTARHTAAYIEMLVSSCLGLIAAMVLSIDAWTLAKDPTADLSCNISAVVSCGKVGLSWQASLLGFPNAFLGILFESIVITIAVAALGGVRFPRWFANAAQILYTIAIFFAYWLFTQAYFVIGALCPWCMLVTLTTTLVFTSMLRVNILDNNFHLPPRTHAYLSGWIRAGADVLLAILIMAVIIGMVVVKYGPVLFAG